MIGWVAYNEIENDEYKKQQIESFKSQTNQTPYGICTDYPSLLVNFYE